MPNKIHQQLKQLAKEILEMEKPYDYQKVYDATLLLFERLILIKNAEGFNKDFWEDLETNFDQAVDFIKGQPVAETATENFNDREELPPIMDTIKEIVKEIPETKPSVADLFQENTAVSMSSCANLDCSIFHVRSRNILDIEDIISELSL